MKYERQILFKKVWVKKRKYRNTVMDNQRRQNAKGNTAYNSVKKTVDEDKILEGVVSLQEDYGVKMKRMSKEDNLKYLKDEK